MNEAPILVLDDEPDIRRFVSMSLQSEGWAVVQASTATEALQLIGEQAPRLALIDLGLPDRDGVELVRELRSWTALPVLVLSARSEERDKIRALDVGADDYLVKPFGVGELLARVRALMRRAAPREDSPHCQFGDVAIDFSRRLVTRGGEAIHLTPIEYRLLAAFIAGQDRVLTHRQLLREVWGPSFVDSPHYLRVYVGHLRQKLEHDPARPRHFVTETGVGYRFCP
jgi:two-component system, OmpR family, KDP operon response regulator KdpE